MTRQAMNAVEAGYYVPSTLVAMRLAKALGCRVEDLFQLTDVP
jgi:DNA-binding XRE family transcriptional regulator